MIRTLSRTDTIKGASMKSLTFCTKRPTKNTMLGGITHINGQNALTPGSRKRNLSGRRKWIVQKFGGTSLGNFATTIAEDIVSAGLKKYQVAVVCSARSTKTNSEGVTDRLLRAAEDVLVADSIKYVDIVEELRLDHVTVGQETIEDTDVLNQYIAHVDLECHNLLKVLESARFLEAVTNQTEDMIISVGEKWSCLLMTALLQTRGVDAVYVDLSKIVARTSTITALTEDCYRYFALAIRNTILALNSRAVPIITGFFGKVPGGLLKQVGRGYPDLCAAITAVALQALEIQIWKEVGGVFTADPQKVSTARLLEYVTPAEMAELTFYGSEVIHPFAVDQVLRANIPIVIKSVMNSRSTGTVICPDPADTVLAKHILMLLHNHWVLSNLDAQPKQPTAVTAKPQITILNIQSNKKTPSHSFLAFIFNTLDQNGLSVDLISSSEVQVSVAIHSKNAPPCSFHRRHEIQIRSEALQRVIDSLEACGSVILVPDLAIITLVGRDLRDMRGVSGQFLNTLGQHGIHTEMISQGASGTSVSCVIKEQDATYALNAIHSTLFTTLA